MRNAAISLLLLLSQGARLFVSASDNPAVSAASSSETTSFDNTTSSKSGSKESHHRGSELPLHFPKIKPHEFAKRYISVEPFASNWCVKQFSNELGSVPDREVQLPLEPYLGSYCFAQFSDSLSTLDEKDTLASFYLKHHRDWKEYSIEHYLKEWGNDLTSAETSFGAGGKVPVEKYIAEWCAAELGSLGLSIDPEKVLEESATRTPIEPFIGNWCFETYPSTLVVELNKTATIQDLYKNHESLEEILMAWYFRNHFHATEQKLAIGAIILIAGAMMCSVGCICFFIGCYFRRRQRIQGSWEDKEAIKEVDLAFVSEDPIV